MYKKMKNENGAIEMIIHAFPFCGFTMSIEAIVEIALGTSERSQKYQTNEKEKKSPKAHFVCKTKGR